MKPLKSTSRKNRSRSGKLSLNRQAAEVRRRAVSFKLESLEPRTLLSIGSPTNSILSPTASRSIPGAANANLPPGLLASVQNANTIATVIGPTTPASQATSHISNGRADDFRHRPRGDFDVNVNSHNQPWSVQPKWRGGPSSASQAAALAALTKSFTSLPQYVVMPTSGLKSDKIADDFEGPAGYAPAQIAGAYGISNVVFSNGVKGDGAGQTIAVTDVGDYPGFVNSTDPNFDSSALHVFDQEFGLPDPPSFTKYNMLGQTSPLPAEDEGWFLEIALDVEWAHAMAPAANIELVEASQSDLNDLAHASNTAATLLGASVVSQSWGLLEVELGSSYVQYLENTWYVPAVASNPNVTFLAATGDGSAVNGPIFPSSSPLNVGVGGTSLFITGDTWEAESAWSGGGGGPSEVFPVTPPTSRASSPRISPLRALTARLPCGPIPTFPQTPISRRVCRCTNRNCTAVGSRWVAPAWRRPSPPAPSGSPTRDAFPWEAKR